MPGRDLPVYAAMGGFEGALALAVFYRALAMGAMGLTAALTGLMTALDPGSFFPWFTTACQQPLPPPASPWDWPPSGSSPANPPN